MNNKKNLRRVSVLISAQTLYNLQRLAVMGGYNPQEVGRVIDKLTRDRMAQMRRVDNMRRC